MTHDSLSVAIATGSAQNLGKVENKTGTWGKLRDRLSKPLVDTKTSYADYVAMTPDEQGPLKQAPGYFLGGHCEGGQRRNDAIAERSVLCLDIDEVSPDCIQELELGLGDVSQYEWFAHTTRKHCAEKPRWRVVLPLAAPVPAEKFQALARIMASKVFADPQESIDAVDDVSFRPAQMMYWPSICHDGEFDTMYNAGELIDPDTELEAFGDWQDIEALPYSAKRSKKKPTEFGKRAEDPTQKTGIIGAFCRTYDVEQAIAKFLPHIYLKSKRKHRKPRYTYLRGSGSEGAVVEDDGLFLYSNHGSDPCAERSTNAFDLVRLHLFGEQDVDADGDTSPMGMPSFKLMEDLARADPEVRKREDQEMESRLGIDEFDDLEDVAAGEDDFESLLGGDTEDPDSFESDDTESGDAGASDVPGWVAKLNKKHSVAFVEGKTVILTKKPNGAMAYGSATDLHTFYENRRRATDKGTTEPITKAWMRHPDRASYPNGVRFAPGLSPKGAYNHWTGFSVEPDATKSCDLFLEHLRDTICGGNDMAYQWLIRWFAHMIQKPGEKPGTAVVLKGRKGTGKDTVGEYVGGLFPRHHTKVANSEHLLGKFNAHQEQTLLLHVEEGFWAGDKKAEGTLKYIITSEQVQIEPKGVNAFQVPSVLRIFMSSNEEWVVPTTFDERRFFVMNVIGSKRDAAYYAALRHEMRNGGRAALLHHLQTLSLRGYDVRNPPMTEGLRDQKLQSLKNVDKWWYETLVGEDLPSSGNGFDEEDAGWTSCVNIQTSVLRSAYRNWMREHRYEGGILGEADFGKRLRELVPEMKIVRPWSNGGVGRKRCYQIPPLQEARVMFEKVLGLALDWGDLPDDDPSDGFDLG